MAKQIYRSYLSRLQYNQHVEGNFADLSYLLQDEYDELARQLMATAVVWDTTVLRLSRLPKAPVGSPGVPTQIEHRLNFFLLLLFGGIGAVAWSLVGEV